MRFSASFLFSFLLFSLFLLSSTVFGQHLPLPPLRYSYTALQPIISESLLRLHHTKHHQAYTDGTNGVLEKLRADPATKSLAKLGIDRLLGKLNQVPESLRNTLRNQGGGYVNHDLFFRTLKSPVKSIEDSDSFIIPTPNGLLMEQIEKQFGSFQQFQTQFTAAATTVFGSGWTFLYLNASASASVPELQISTYPNQDTPLNHGCYPILALDQWEHAWYLDYLNRRAEWIGQWWKLVDWEEVEKVRQEALINIHAEQREKQEL